MHTTLTTRRLGATDMEITTVGFGAWAIGGGDWVFGWGPQDIELTREDLVEIAGIIEKTGAGSGPALPR